MRIFISTYIDAPDDADKYQVLDDALDAIIPDSDDLTTLPRESQELLNNCIVNFTDDTDKE
jgi:hypothetical protein